VAVQLKQGVFVGLGVFVADFGSIVAIVAADGFAVTDNKDIVGVNVGSFWMPVGVKVPILVGFGVLVLPA
jgi:hypothetical protein